VSTASLLLGAHVSTAGGVPEAPPRALAIEATAMQMFTKMANRWAERDCENEECRLFRERLAETGDIHCPRCGRVLRGRAPEFGA